MVKRIRVGVDSGVIEMARHPEQLRAGGELYHKIQDLALWTALTVWDGKKGAIRTPHGDGLYEVVYDPVELSNWRAWEGRPYAFLVNLPKGELAKPFRLFVGDVDRADGSIDFPEHNLIVFGWVDETLVFTSRTN